MTEPLRRDETRANEYKTNLNAESPPWRSNQIPELDPREVYPRNADIAVSPPPIPANGFRPGASARYEYTSGHKGIFYSQYIKALGTYIDDLSQELGDDIYERMLTDPQISSCLKVWKVGVLSENGKIQSAIKDEKHPKYEQAQKVASFCEWVIAQMEIPIYDVLYEMLDGFIFGHKVAEIVYKVGDYTEYNTDGTEGATTKRWMWESIRTKPRGSTAFLVDAYMRVLGILAQIPGLPYPIVSGQLVSDPSTIPNLLPTSKFMIFTYDPKDNDPRGRSGARPCYVPWWNKMMTIGEMLKYIATYSVPSLIAKTPPNALPKQELDAAGAPTGKMTNPEQDLANTLAKLRNNSVVVVAAGVEIEPVPVAPASAESVFLQFIEFYNREIAKGILAQTLATEEGQHMARAASEVHMDVMQMSFAYPKSRVQTMVKTALRNLVRFNFGEEAARDLTPEYALTEINRNDWQMWSGIAVAMFESGYLTYEQKQWLDQKLGLPKTTISEDEEQIPGNVPAVYVYQRMMTELQQMQAQAEAQAQAQAQPPQGQVPAGFASPNHPANSPQGAPQAGGAQAAPSVAA
jgi:hypothetical protein